MASRDRPEYPEAEDAVGAELLGEQVVHLGSLEDPRTFGAEVVGVSMVRDLSERPTAASEGAFCLLTLRDTGVSDVVDLRDMRYFDAEGWQHELEVRHRLGVQATHIIAEWVDALPSPSPKRNSFGQTCG